MSMNTSSEVIIQRVLASPEVTPLSMPGQVVVKTLTPGEIEVGLNRRQLVRFRYESEGVIVCRSNAEEWVRWRMPMSMLVVPIPRHSLLIAAEEAGASGDVVATPDLRDPRVLALLTAIQANIENGAGAGGLFLESTLLALAAALLGASRTGRRPSSKSGLTARQVAHVQEFMLANLEQDIRLGDLAAIHGISQGHFGQMFRRSTGISPHQYFLQLRLQRGKRLLGIGGSRILDIAVACGFKTQQHFATAFRNRYGIAPSVYQLRFGK